MEKFILGLFCGYLFIQVLPVELADHPQFQPTDQQVIW